jgi:hypothetical protein
MAPNMPPMPPAAPTGGAPMVVEAPALSALYPDALPTAALPVDVAKRGRAPNGGTSGMAPIPILGTPLGAGMRDMAPTGGAPVVTVEAPALSALYPDALPTAALPVDVEKPVNCKCGGGAANAPPSGTPIFMMGGAGMHNAAPTGGAPMVVEAPMAGKTDEG